MAELLRNELSEYSANSKKKKRWRGEKYKYYAVVNGLNGNRVYTTKQSAWKNVRNMPLAEIRQFPDNLQAQQFIKNYTEANKNNTPVGPAKKYYAVINGHEGNKIYWDIDEMKRNTKKSPGVRVKMFFEYKRAEQYLREYIPPTPKEKVPVNEFKAYIDGSFNKRDFVYGYGSVIIKNRTVVHTMSGAGDKKDAANMRNVSGELLGAIQTVKWAIELKIPKIHIYYDYLGIEYWPTGEWQANTPLTQWYRDFMHQAAQRIDIVYHKVKAHSGNKYNDMADELAKEAVRQ